MMSTGLVMLGSQTAEQLVPEPSAYEAEIATGTLNRHNHQVFITPQKN